jgi:hypothetical protein
VLLHSHSVAASSTLELEFRFAIFSQFEIHHDRFHLSSTRSAMSHSSSSRDSLVTAVMNDSSPAEKT